MPQPVRLPLHMKKRLPALLLGCLLALHSGGQTIFDWVNTTDANFSGGGTDRWFDNFLLINLQNEPTGAGVILRFNNNVQLNANNNVGGTYNIHQLIFGNAASNSRVVTGNPVRLSGYLSAFPRIENQSLVAHTINCALEGDGNAAVPLELNPQSGNLIINGAINNQGSPVHVLGGAGRTLELNAQITGTGSFEVQQNSFVQITGVKDFTGATILRAGVVRISSNVHPSLPGPFGNNAGSLFLAGGSIQNAASVFERPVTISGNGSNLDAFAAARIVAAPISAAAGNWTLSVGNNTFPSANGQILTLTGAITNGAGVLAINKIGTSTCILSGANSFSGGLTISGGVLTIQSIGAYPAGGNLTLSGGTLQAGSVGAGSAINAGVLQMTASSVIDLGTGANPFDLIFSGTGPGFTGTLTINNWSAAIAKRIRITNTAHINTVLGQIQFTGYGPGAVIRNGDELWPAGLFISQASGNFGAGATWIGGVAPGAGSSVLISPGHIVQFDGNYTLRSIDVAGSLQCNAAHTITIGNSFSKISNYGIVQFTNGTVVWNGAGGYTDGTAAVQFFNLTLNGTLSTVRNPQVNGVFLFNAGGAIATGTVLYGPSSTLQYNKNGGWLMAREWNFYTTPANIVVGGNTNINFSTSSGEIGNVSCSGNLTIAAGSNLDLSLKRGALSVGGDIIINGVFVLPLQVWGGALDLRLFGNWVRTSTAAPVNFNNRSVFLEGTSNVSIDGPDGIEEEFRVLNLLKAAGRTVTLNDPVRVTANLGLSSGYILSTTSNYLALGNFANLTLGASVNSFVSGPFKKIGQTWPPSAPFIFPIGKIVGSEFHYRPLQISTPANATDEYFAEFHRQSPLTQGPINPAAMVAPERLSHLSLCEYWDLTKSFGAANLDVTLFWSNHPSGRSRCNVGAYVNSLTELVVVPYHNGMWGDQFTPFYGRSATTGVANPTTAPFLSSITWNGPADGSNIDSYQKFTLGSTDWRFNPLDFIWLNLRAVLDQQEEAVRLDFETAGDEKIYRYEIESSGDGRRFNVLATVNALQQSRGIYRYLDRSMSFGKRWYRVKAVAKDGKTYFSDIVTVTGMASIEIGSLYPNPVAGGMLNLRGLPDAGLYQWQLVGIDGRIETSGQFFAAGGGTVVQLVLPAAITSGTYRLRVVQPGKASRVYTIQVVR